MSELTKKAFADAEKELQEKEVNHLKGIITQLLTSQKKAEQQKVEVDKKIKTIKTAIEDFKHGRLDKVKEMLETDPKAKDAVPLQITIIQNEIYRQYPAQPWRWYYAVDWFPQNQVYISTSSGLNAISTTTTTASAGTPGIGWQSTGGTVLANAVNLCGFTASNFTGGTYNLGDNGIVNL